MKMRALSERELTFIRTSALCPYCRSDLLFGPEGGMCVNLLCSHKECRSKFNFCFIMGQYLGQETEERHDLIVP